MSDAPRGEHVDQCQVGESMADDYFQHAEDCPECGAYEAQRIETITGRIADRAEQAEAEVAALRAQLAEAQARDGQWQQKWARAVGTGTSNTLREADRADAAESAFATERAKAEALAREILGMGLSLGMYDPHESLDEVDPRAVSERVEALARELAALVAAAKKLTKEIRGFLGCWESELRPIVSTTNLRVLRHHQEAVSALFAHPLPPEAK